MRPADVDAVAALEAATFSRPWSVETFRRLVGEATVLVRVADVVGTVAGYGVVMAVADQGEIANLAVAAQHRGRGLGGRLLDALLAAAAGAGVTRVYLEVRPSNTAARRLYAARGFTALGRRRDYYEAPREDALVLSADLTTTTNDGAGGTA
jgi:ribosomal-protein-alanine N-acetyltransferase